MEFKSVINYFLLAGRILFIILCFFFLGVCFNAFPLFRNALPGNILLRIIIASGLLWGIITTLRALIFRTKIILITQTEISIQEVFRARKKIYAVSEIKKITSGTAYDMGIYSKGIKIEFKNGDRYEFIFYDYLNFGKMERSFGSLRKVYENSFI